MRQGIQDVVDDHLAEEPMSDQAACQEFNFSSSLVFIFIHYY